MVCKCFYPGLGSMDSMSIAIHPVNLVFLSSDPYKAYFQAVIRYDMFWFREKDVTNKLANFKA